MKKIIPEIKIFTRRIKNNCEVVTSLLKENGISCFGVTKGVCGNPDIARAMLDGGCVGIGDSRISNLKKLKIANINTSLMLLRLPMLSEIDVVIQYADISLVSEIKTIQALGQVAKKIGITHKIIVMVDLGDLREGIWPPENIFEIVVEIEKIKGIKLIGIGTNLACFNGVIPDIKNMEVLANIARKVSEIIDRKLELISGGNSSGLPLVETHKIPHEINSFRVGETILLGRDINNNKAFPGTRQDAFVISAEIVEINTKPLVSSDNKGYDPKIGL